MQITTGFKATDANMQCRGLQYVLGEWQEVVGPLELCENGLHFCSELAHTYQFYDDPSDRRFKCEVEGVMEIPVSPGVKMKYVARRLRLVEEVHISGHHNTGDYNSGQHNTGDYNTGDYNTGDYNSGDYNTGDYNTGHYNTGQHNTVNCNTGHYNSGQHNTGDYNTGNYNTGDYNSGQHNTGDYNTGNYNTGDYNSGDYNVGNNLSGYFCTREQPVFLFNQPVEESRSVFLTKYDQLMNQLYNKICLGETIYYSDFKSLPNITPERLESFINAFTEARSKNTLL